jgi:hypothetical protein
LAPSYNQQQEERLLEYEQREQRQLSRFEGAAAAASSRTSAASSTAAAPSSLRVPRLDDGDRNGHALDLLAAGIYDDNDNDDDGADENIFEPDMPNEGLEGGLVQGAASQIRKKGNRNGLLSRLRLKQGGSTREVRAISQAREARRVAAAESMASAVYGYDPITGRKDNNVHSRKWFESLEKEKELNAILKNSMV